MERDDPPWHSDPELHEIATLVMGHSLIRLLICSHGSLVRCGTVEHASSAPGIKGNLRWELYLRKYLSIGSALHSYFFVKSFRPYVNATCIDFCSVYQWALNSCLTVLLNHEACESGHENEQMVEQMTDWLRLFFTFLLMVQFGNEWNETIWQCSVVRKKDRKK